MPLRDDQKFKRKEIKHRQRHKGRPLPSAEKRNRHENRIAPQKPNDDKCSCRTSRVARHSCSEQGKNEPGSKQKEPDRKYKRHANMNRGRIWISSWHYLPSYSA